MVAADVTDRASLDRALGNRARKIRQSARHLPRRRRSPGRHHPAQEEGFGARCSCTEGAAALRCSTRRRATFPLDFFALFSSVSALTPPDGQVDYCAANAFLNAYAQSRPAGRNFLVIGWGPWSQIGMVAPKAEMAADPTPFQPSPPRARRSRHRGTHGLLRHAQRREATGSLPNTVSMAATRYCPARPILKSPSPRSGKKSASNRSRSRTSSSSHPCASRRTIPPSSTPSCRKNADGYQFSVTSHDVVYVTGQCRPSPGTRAEDRPQGNPRTLSQLEKEGTEKYRGNAATSISARAGKACARFRSATTRASASVELPAEFRATRRMISRCIPALMDMATGVAMYPYPGLREGRRHPAALRLQASRRLRHVAAACLQPHAHAPRIGLRPDRLRRHAGHRKRRRDRGGRGVHSQAPAQRRRRLPCLETVESPRGTSGGRFLPAAHGHPDARGNRGAATPAEKPAGGDGLRIAFAPVARSCRWARARRSRAR